MSAETLRDEEYHNKLLGIRFGCDEPEPALAFLDRSGPTTESGLEKEISRFQEYPDIQIDVRLVDGGFEYFQNRGTYVVQLTKEQAYNAREAMPVFRTLMQDKSLDSLQEAVGLSEQYFPHLRRYADTAWQMRYTNMPADDWWDEVTPPRHEYAQSNYEPDPAPDFNPETDL